MSEQSQVERTYQEVKQRIIEGHYRPGVHLSESMLARIHHSSRTPVREALSRLLQEGYVEFVPKRGYAAAPITVAAVQNIFEVRRLLESAAAAQAATSAADDDIRRLRNLLEGAPHLPGERAAYLATLTHNQRFHLGVAETSGNAFLVDLIRQCLTKMDRVLSLGIDYSPFHDGSPAEHRLIVEAIGRRNESEARRAVEQHLDHSHELLMRALMRGDARGVGI